MRFATAARLRKHANAASSHLEPLEGRTYFAVTAFFARAVLTVIGDGASNAITVSAAPSGRLLVNSGAVRVVGRSATATNTRQVNIFGGGGNDALALDETNGRLPPAMLHGGAGADTLTGGSGADTLGGDGGNDFLCGAAGADLLLGGDGDDALTGAAGDDSAFGQDGNDVLAWAPADGSDRDEGGDGTDTVSVNGAADSENFSAVPNGDRVRFQRATPAPFALDIGTAENLSLRANGGDDTFVWIPGDGSDTIEGQNGRDVLEFEGSDAAEKFELSANGTRARFTRDVGNVAMDLNGLEELDLSTLGGADTVAVNDQSATGLNTFNVDLDGSADTGFGDDQPDTVVVNGTDGNDVGQVRSDGIGPGARVNATVSAIPFVNITHAQGHQDALDVDTRGGNDTLDASDLLATNAQQTVRLTLNGGAGNDTLTGSQGSDVIVSNPGDGNDTIEGGDGEDSVVFNGTDLADVLGVSPNGSHVRLSRDFDNSNSDVHGVEELGVNALGGADRVVVNDLAGTGLIGIRVDLAANPGANTPDGQADSVSVNGRAAGDVIPVLGGNRVILVNGGFANGSGLPYDMLIRSVDPTDALEIDGNGGDDLIDASALQTPVNLRLEGRAGNDTLLGSPFSDVLVAGDGDDVVDGNGGDDAAFLGDGNDLFVWDPADGSDAVEGMEGADTIRFNGGAGGDAFDLSADADRLRMTRNNNPVVVTADDVEAVNVVPLGGQDGVTVNDLSATDVVGVDVSLSNDALQDLVFVNGSAGDDRITVSDLAGAPGVILPTTAVRVTGADPAKDVLTVNGLGGDDTIDASALPAGRILFSADGGDGNDTLTGSAGDDFLAGGPGDDLLTGGPGIDTFDGGPGINVLRQD